jgi:hypothetical protein
MWWSGQELYPAKAGLGDLTDRHLDFRAPQERVRRCDELHPSS